MDLEFKDKRTEKIHNEFLQKNRTEYLKLIKNDFYEHFFEKKNGIPKHLKINLDCVQVTEIYSRIDKNKIESLFSNITKNMIDSKKISDIDSKLNQAVEKILNLNTSYITWFSDLRIKVDGKFFDSFSFSINAENPSLFRIIFNFYLSDFTRFKFWKLATAEVKDQLEIIDRSPLKKKNKKYSINHKYGFNYKKNELKKLETVLSKELTEYIRSNASGLLSSLDIIIPCTYIYSYNSELFIDIYKGYKYYNIAVEKERSDFFKIIASVNETNDIYYYDENDNYFIPSDQNRNKAIMMKVFRTGVKQFPIHQVSWLVTIENILILQYQFMHEILNKNIESDIVGKKLDIRDNRNKINKISSLIDVLIRSYESDKEFREYKTFKLIRKELNEEEYDFIEHFGDRIEATQRRIKEQVPLLKEIYNEKDQDRNHTLNKWIQFSVLGLALLTLFQGIITCKINNRKLPYNDPNISESIEEESIEEEIIEEEIIEEEIIEEGDAR